MPFSLARNHLLQALQILSQGVESMTQELQSRVPLPPNGLLQEMKNLQGFLDTLQRVKDTLPEDRLLQAVRHTAGVFQKRMAQTPCPEDNHSSAASSDSPARWPEFLYDAHRQIGPDIRISEDQMSVWVRIRSEEAVFFTPETIVSCLEDRGVVSGIETNLIQEIFQQHLFDQDILVAQGINPKPGVHGRIEFCFDLGDFSRIPKLLEDNRVSFKDIDLFQFVTQGELLARKVPPNPGVPGRTVTGRTLPCSESRAAVFPEIKNTIVSEDGSSLYADIDGCITKRNGRIHLEPCLLVDTVSYETGHIQSEISVIVRGNVLSGFSVKSEGDILVHGIVEGAHLKSEKNIVVKGGVQGKDKALLEAKGDVNAKYIANASVINDGNVQVEVQILQSRIWSGGRVFVSGPNGEIIGGEVEADSELNAATIGSGLGVRTRVRLGGRSSDLSALLAETQEKMIRQEEAAEKCSQIVDSLGYQINRPLAPVVEMQKAIQRAQDLLEEAQGNIGDLQRQHDNLSLQYEESLKNPRIIQIRKSILPGTVLDIQGVQMTVENPTGPVQVIRQDDQLVILPYGEKRSR